MTVAEPRGAGTRLRVPWRPRRPLSTLGLWRVVRRNSLSAWDEELFDELYVDRRFFWGRLVAISDPDGIRRVLQDNYDNYPRLQSIRRLFAFEAGTGIFHVEGEGWRRHRRLLNRTLEPRALLDDFPLLVRLASDMTRHLAAVPAGQAIDIGAAFSHFVTHATRLVFATEDREIEPMLDKVAHYPLHPSLFHVAPLPSWFPLAGGSGASRDMALGFRPMLDALIARRREAGYAGRRDLIRRLIEARDPSTGQPLADAELRDEIITLAATAYTVLRPLTWVWYLLALHPDVEMRLHGEVDRVVESGVPDSAHLAKLAYLRQVLDETMRLYPPLPVMILRRAAAPDMVCGRRLAAGSIVAIMPWVLHRHRKLWPDPDRFDPDRFSSERSAGRSRFSYLPFGIGPHVCIGAQLTVMQMLVAVAMLARRFRFRLVPGQQIEPTAWINLRPSRSIMMTVERRAAGGP